MIMDLPSKVITAVLFQTTIYFMTNLRRTASAFFVWFLFNFVLVLAMSMWFRLLGSVARRREHTMAPSGILILLCVIYIGYVVPVPYMVDWLAWFRFVNPIAYAFESLLINEVSHFLDTLFVRLTDAVSSSAAAGSRVPLWCRRDQPTELNPQPEGYVPRLELCLAKTLCMALII